MKTLERDNGTKCTVSQFIDYCNNISYDDGHLESMNCTIIHLKCVLGNLLDHLYQTDKLSEDEVTKIIRGF